MLYNILIFVIVVEPVPAEVKERLTAIRSQDNFIQSTSILQYNELMIIDILVYKVIQYNDQLNFLSHLLMFVCHLHFVLDSLTSLEERVNSFFKRCGQSHHSDSALRDQQFSDLMRVRLLFLT